MIGIKPIKHSLGNFKHEDEFVDSRTGITYIIKEKTDWYMQGYGKDGGSYQETFYTYELKYLYKS